MDQLATYDFLLVIQSHPMGLSLIVAMINGDLNQKLQFFTPCI